MLCSSCGQTIPDRAKFCLRCGARMPKPTRNPVAPASTLAGNLGWFAGAITRDLIHGGAKVWVLCALIVVFVVFVIIRTRERAAQESSIAEQQKQDAANAQKKSEAEAAAFSGMTAAEHLQRAQLALKLDATPDEIDEGLRNLGAISPSAPEAASAKALRRKLAAAKARLLKAEEEQSREAARASAGEAKKNAALEAVAKRAARDALAKTMEDNLLHQGLNVDVLATGKDHTILRIKWVLVSKALAYQLSEKGDVTDVARAYGFKRVLITDGYDQAWSWDLK
jgi:hypothetical protein